MRSAVPRGEEFALPGWVADATAELHPEAGFRREAGHHVAILLAPRTGAVQVHDMQVFEAHGRVSPGNRERIAAVAGALFEVALEEAHAAAFAEVDGRDDAHYRSRKFASSRAPGADDFSG